MGSEFEKLERALTTKNKRKVKTYLDDIPVYLKTRSTKQRQIRMGRVLDSRYSKAINKIPKNYIITLAKSPRGIEKIFTSCCPNAINAIPVLALRAYLHNPDLTARQKRARLLRVDKSTLAEDTKEALQMDDLLNCHCCSSEPVNDSPKNLIATQLFNFQSVTDAVGVSSGIHLNINNESSKKIVNLVNELFNRSPKNLSADPLLDSQPVAAAVEANSSSQQGNDLSEYLNDDSLFDVLLANATTSEGANETHTVIKTESACEDSVVPANKITSFQDLYKDLGFFEQPPERKPQEASSNQNYLTTPRCSPTIF